MRKLASVIILALAMGCGGEYEGPGEIRFSIAFDDSYGCGVERAVAWTGGEGSSTVEANLIFGDRLTGMLYGFPAGEQRLIQVEVVDSFDMAVYSGSTRVDVGKEVVFIDDLQLIPGELCAKRIARMNAAPTPSPAGVYDSPVILAEPSGLTRIQAEPPTTVRNLPAAARGPSATEIQERLESRAKAETKGKTEARYAAEFESFLRTLRSGMSTYRSNCVGTEPHFVGHDINGDLVYEDRFKGATPECRDLESNIETTISDLVSIYQDDLKTARREGITPGIWRQEMNRIGLSDPAATQAGLRREFEAIKAGK